MIMHTTIARGGTYGAIVTCMLVLATGCGGRDNDAATDSGVASAVPKTDSAERSSAGEVATADSNANLAGAADDRTAVRAVAMIHQSEIGAARMALTNAQNKDVKEFAQKMIDDHGKGLSELRSVASKAGLPVPDSGRGYGEEGRRCVGTPRVTRAT
jgi:predicted outer membrane protein